MSVEEMDDLQKPLGAKVKTGDVDYTPENERSRPLLKGTNISVGNAECIFQPLIFKGNSFVFGGVSFRSRSKHTGSRSSLVAACILEGLFSL